MDEQKVKQQAEQIVDKIKELVKEGNVSRVLLKRNGETLLNLSLNTGIVGALVGLHAAPFAVLTAALVSFGLDCDIEIEKQDGTVLSFSDTQVGIKLESIKQSVKEKLHKTPPAADTVDADDIPFEE